jgi:hypothetical protein
VTVMSASGDRLHRLDWRKAQASISNGACVEVALANGAVAVRDSRDPDGNVLLYSINSWHSFLRAARVGNFDGTNF